MIVQLNHTPGFVVITMVTQGTLTLSSIKINEEQKHIVNNVCFILVSLCIVCVVIFSSWRKYLPTSWCRCCINPFMADQGCLFECAFPFMFLSLYCVVSCFIAFTQWQAFRGFLPAAFKTESDPQISHVTHHTGGIIKDSISG